MTISIISVIPMVICTGLHMICNGYSHGYSHGLSIRDSSQFELMPRLGHFWKRLQGLEILWWGFVKFCKSTHNLVTVYVSVCKSMMFCFINRNIHDLGKLSRPFGSAWRPGRAVNWGTKSLAPELPVSAGELPYTSRLKSKATCQALVEKSAETAPTAKSYDMILNPAFSTYFGIRS